MLSLYEDHISHHILEAITCIYVLNLLQSPKKKPEIYFKIPHTSVIQLIFLVLFFLLHIFHIIWAVTVIVHGTHQNLRINHTTGPIGTDLTSCTYDNTERFFTLLQPPLLTLHQNSLTCLKSYNEISAEQYTLSHCYHRLYQCPRYLVSS